MKTFVRLVDSLSEWTGLVVRWLCVALVFIMSFEVLMRYAFNSPSFYSYEISIMLGTAIYALGWSYVHKHRAHVRVDIIHTNLSSRKRALIDTLGDVFIFLPFIVVLSISSFDWALTSWLQGEVSRKTGWYPPMAPIRTVVFLGLLLFLLQGIVEFVRNIYMLIRDKQYD